MARQLSGHAHFVCGVAFSPDSQTLLSGCSDNTARVWRVATGKQLRQLDRGGQVTTLAFSIDGMWAATGCCSGDNSVRLWSTASWNPMRTLQSGSEVWGVLFTPDSRKVVVESNNDLSVWDVATGQKGLTVAGGTVNVGKCLSMTPLGDRLAAASNSSKTVRVFDSSSLVDVARIPVSALARTPASAWSRVPTREAERLSSTRKSCLPLEVFRRMRGEMRRGIEGALAGEAVELLSVIQQRWLPRLPLGVLHRLPPSDRDTCVAFVGAGQRYRY